MDEEIENKINFLDITSSEDHNNIMFSIYRKPIATDIIIPNDSCHTPEHKLAAVRYLTNQLSTCRMNSAEKEKENHTIKQILHNNKYDIAILNKVSWSKNEQSCKKERVQTIWVKFTYAGKQTKFIIYNYLKTPNSESLWRLKTL